MLTEKDIEYFKKYKEIQDYVEELSKGQILFIQNRPVDNIRKEK